MIDLSLCARIEKSDDDEDDSVSDTCDRFFLMGQGKDSVPQSCEDEHSSFTKIGVINDF